ncbi:hypothetical protein NHX12_009256 [Muraenolepis orangiensis]|uniref:Uncharacterized protein n=1 Tax=Muraenolepis orangiensis TaxID=630683 RepID=A0A9Q0IAN1_9TELE|nr:hypothetical protein NHX12_009256 [Muraenolepis orangiensis]
MAAKGEKPLWDPYETSQKREFFYRPYSNTTEFTRPATSKSFRDRYSPSGPVGPTAYSEDFGWKSTSSQCIRTGSASGQRRNNPHPSQGFLTWRLPKGVLPSSADCSSAPRSGRASEEEIRNALTAQYCSTYRTDFLGRIPQGADHVTSYKEGGLVPLRSRQQGPRCTLTEMRDNYCQSKLKDELQDNRFITAYGCNKHNRVHCRGIGTIRFNG